MSFKDGIVKDRAWLFIATELETHTPKQIINHAS
jgi:hypothetical protein